jgi:hypothetical protein
VRQTPAVGGRPGNVAHGDNGATLAAREIHQRSRLNRVTNGFRDGKAGVRNFAGIARLEHRRAKACGEFDFSTGFVESELDLHGYLSVYAIRAEGGPRGEADAAVTRVAGFHRESAAISGWREVNAAGTIKYP